MNKAIIVLSILFTLTSLSFFQEGDLHGIIVLVTATTLFLLTRLKKNLQKIILGIVLVLVSLFSIGSFKNIYVFRKNNSVTIQNIIQTFLERNRLRMLEYTREIKNAGLLDCLQEDVIKNQDKIHSAENRLRNLKKNVSKYRDEVKSDFEESLKNINTTMSNGNMIIDEQKIQELSQNIVGIFDIHDGMIDTAIKCLNILDKNHKTLSFVDGTIFISDMNALIKYNKLVASFNNLSKKEIDYRLGLHIENLAGKK